jgi:hypothetical protein
MLRKMYLVSPEEYLNKSKQKQAFSASMSPPPPSKRRVKKKKKKHKTTVTSGF